jgi:cyclophilin family peptidyl-prolyl cis-trans isomerase
VTKVPPAARVAKQARTATRRRRRRIVSITALGLVLAGTGLFLTFALQPAPPICVHVDTSTIGKKTFPSPPCDMIADQDKQFFIAHLDTTMGPITINLDPGLAPKTVNNFMFLARTGFFDGLTFRVDSKPDHAVVQSGDPTGDGRGGPGYRYGGETPSPITRYVRGTVAMANTGDPSSNGSQFFIVVRDYDAIGTPNQTPRFTFFGFIPDDESLATLDQMSQVPLDGNRPVTPIRINKVTIEDTSRFGTPSP